MRARDLAAALVCVAALTPVAAAAEPVAEPDAARVMTYSEVLAAAAHSPRLKALAAEVEAARAGVVDAGVYPHNPEVGLSVADRGSGPEATTDREVAVAQTFELARQRARRRAVAGSHLEAARFDLDQARRIVLAEAARAFARADSHRKLLGIERAQAELAASFAELVERSLDAGSATALDLALAQAGLARAESARAAARGRYDAARARLTELVGGTAEAPVTPAGGLPELSPPPALGELLSLAASRRGDLLAARERVETARARVALARALRFPDLTVAAHAGREEGDDVVGLSLSVPIPLFDRNQGGEALAEAGVAAARAELAREELEVERQVAAARGRLTRALESRRLTRQLGETALEDGLELVERSFDAGKIGIAELIVYRRELLEGRRQVVSRESEVWEAALDLAVAVGVPLRELPWIGEAEEEAPGAEPGGERKTETSTEGEES